MERIWSCYSPEYHLYQLILGQCIQSSWLVSFPLGNCLNRTTEQDWFYLMHYIHIYILLKPSMLRLFKYTQENALWALRRLAQKVSWRQLLPKINQQFSSQGTILFPYAWKKKIILSCTALFGCTLSTISLASSICSGWYLLSFIFVSSFLTI